MPATAQRKQIRSAHFTVDFGFLTQTARDFWAEHAFDRAVRLITCSGIPLAIAHDIIRGKKRMAQDPNGREGVDGTVLSDKWKPNLGRCQHGIYPDPDDLPKMAADGANAAAELVREREATDRENMNLLFEEIASALNNFNMEEAVRLFERYDELPAKLRKQRPLPYNREFLKGVAMKQHREKERERLGLPKVPDAVDQFVDHQIELDTRPKPVPSKDYEAENAWVLPNGGFHALKTSMEHIWAANKIAGFSERAAEQAGWVKISHGIMGLHIISHEQPTQSQINTLFDWSNSPKAKNKTERETVFTEWLKHWSE